MVTTAKVIVKDAVFYGANDSCARAPTGEYDIERRCDCVGFCYGEGDRSFTLSIDAFLQHVNEGRIALVS